MLIKGIKLGIVFWIVAAVVSCNGGEEVTENNNNNHNGARLMPVETVTVVPGDFEDYIRLTGTVEAIEDAMVSAEASGRVLTIRERGETVREGEVLAQLDDRMIRSQYETAKTAYELAEDTFNRLEALYADSIVSTQDFRNARAQRDQARAQLNQAEKQLRDSKIASPFNGRVEERMVRTGELVNPGMPVVRLVNTDRIRIVAGIPERYSGSITEGSEVILHFRASKGEPETTRISYAGQVIDPETRTFPVEIELQNPEARFKPDMVVDLRVKRGTISDAIIIPRTAIVRNEEGVSVYRSAERNGNKFAELVNIKTGTASGPLIEVVEGLQVGDEIVVSGMRTLSSGDELNILSNETTIERARRLSEADRPVVTF